MNYISMTKAEIANGSGVRVALWVSGCTHHCENCQNPETWSCDAGKPFTHADLIRLLNELSLPYYDGLTLTGGDPMHPDNRDMILKICHSVKGLYPKKTIWMYTGYLFEEIKDEAVLNHIDILIDGEYVDQQRDITLAFMGSTNQRIIDVKKSLETGEVIQYKIN